MRRIALPLAVDLGDERAGRVDHAQIAVLGLAFDRARHAMRAKDGDAAGRDLGQIVYEARALGAQPLHHVAVVDDLVAHIDRRAIFLDRAFHDLDGALDSGAESPRLRQDHPHCHIILHHSQRHYTHKPRRGQRKLTHSGHIGKTLRTEGAACPEWLPYCHNASRWY